MGADLGDLLSAVLDIVVARVFESSDFHRSLLDEIRAAVRQEIAQAPFADRLVDAGEAAERIGVTEGALRKAVARGGVPCHRIGRRVRFRLSELMPRTKVHRA